MNGARLIEWLNLHDRRARSGHARLAIVAAILGIALAAEMIRRGSAESAAALWLAVLVGCTALAFVTTPFRFFWSSDAAPLARYPIEGRPLFRLGLVRNLRIALLAAVPPALGLGGFLALGPVGLALRHALLVLVSLVVSSALAPAVTAMAGALAASERAEAIAKSFGGEFQAPKGSYLGILPGIVGALVILTLIFARSWALEASDTELVFVLSLIATIPLALLALWRADRWANRGMPAVSRELSALNQRRLAHVEATTLGPIERLGCGLLRGPVRTVVTKDLTMMRRRHPAFYLAVGVAVIGAWIAAFAGAGRALEWIAVGLCLLHVYSVVMVGRALHQPIEEQRLLVTLPLSAGERRRIKRAPLLLRTVWISAAVGGALVLVLEPQVAALVIAAAALAALTAGSVIVRTRQN